MTNDETKTEYMPREIVEDQMLVALDDKRKVAVVLNENDLRVIMSWGRSSVFRNSGPSKRLLADLEKLSEAAFGEQT